MEDEEDVEVLKRKLREKEKLLEVQNVRCTNLDAFRAVAGALECLTRLNSTLVRAAQAAAHGKAGIA